MTAEERAEEMVLRVFGRQPRGVVLAVAHAIRAAERDALERAAQMVEDIDTELFERYLTSADVARKIRDLQDPR